MINDKKLTLKYRAKTFYFASLFLPKSIKKDIENLYIFCRYLDDLGDGTSAFTIKMTNNTNGDGADFFIRGQQGKTGTNSHGGDLRLIGGSQTGTGTKQGNVIV